jgi:hypothetical protein
MKTDIRQKPGFAGLFLFWRLVARNSLRTIILAAQSGEGRFIVRAAPRIMCREILRRAD